MKKDIYLFVERYLHKANIISSQAIFHNYYVPCGGFAIWKQTLNHIIYNTGEMFHIIYIPYLQSCLET